MLLGIVDSGFSITYVTEETCRDARLEPTGKPRKFMCVHGKSHAGIETKSYHGTVTLGTTPCTSIVYAIDAHIVVGGQRVDAILGRDALQHFNVGLEWLDGTGHLDAHPKSRPPA